ncbi:MAG TPA: hypothetical protein VGH61_04390 [Steroidobacteraceae bacterium]
MNEIELLRTQLATERRHAREVASSCAAAGPGAPAPSAGAASAAWRLACTEYLGCVLDWFDERDARLAELYARLPAGDAHRGWQELAQFINGPWDTRRAAVEALLATNPRVADWREFGRIDADSIGRERALYMRCRGALPAGSALGPA